MAQGQVCPQGGWVLQVLEVVTWKGLTLLPFSLASGWHQDWLPPFLLASCRAPFSPEPQTCARLQPLGTRSDPSLPPSGLAALAPST